MTFKAKWERLNKKLKRVNNQWVKFFRRNYFAGLAVVLSYWIIVVIIPFSILMAINTWLALLIGTPWVLLGEAYIWPFYITKILRLGRNGQ